MLTYADVANVCKLYSFVSVGYLQKFMREPTRYLEGVMKGVC